MKKWLNQIWKHEKVSKRGNFVFFGQERFVSGKVWELELNLNIYFLEKYTINGCGNKAGWRGSKICVAPTLGRCRYDPDRPPAAGIHTRKDCKTCVLITMYCFLFTCHYLYPYTKYNLFFILFPVIDCIIIWTSG